MLRFPAGKGQQFQSIRGGETLSTNPYRHPDGFDFPHSRGTACRARSRSLALRCPLPQTNVAHLFRGEAFAVRTAGILPALFSRGYDPPERISFTSSLVSIGALGPALNTGKPVIVSMRIWAFPRRVRGVNIIRPSRTVTSSGSPGRSRSLLRTEWGSATRPCLKTLVCIGENLS